MDGCSILITGGGSGIGRATAEHLGRLGARVTIVGRRAGPLNEVVEGAGGAVLGIVADVTDAIGRQRAIEAAADHGGGCLDGLVNNAGNVYRAMLEEADEHQVTELFRCNVVGPMMLTAMATELLARTAGAVVFISSAQTRRAIPGNSAYAATKAAVEGMARTLAVELAPSGVRVACVRPGVMPTEINVRAGLTEQENQERLQAAIEAHPLRRLGTPLDVAEAVAYLLSADWVTGAVLDVDGGLGLG